MKMIITNKHVIFSAENALYRKTVNLTHDQVISKLKSKGIECYTVNGMYDKPEKSILVVNPTDLVIDLITQLCTKLGQESIIQTENGTNMLLFLNGPNAGKAYYGKGTQYFNSKPENYYTQLGETYFSHNLDFSRLI